MHAARPHRSPTSKRDGSAVSATYPTDIEARIFYALAMNQTALPTDKTYANS